MGSEVIFAEEFLFIFTVVLLLEVSNSVVIPLKPHIFGEISVRLLFLLV